MKPTTKQVKLKGRKVTLYSSGVLRSFLDITNQTFVNWERGGVMPPPLLTLKGQTQRWYLADEVMLYSEAHKQAMTGGRNKTTKSLHELRAKMSMSYKAIQRAYKMEPEKLAESLPQGLDLRPKKNRSLRKCKEEYDQETQN